MNITFFGANSVAALWKRIIERIPIKLSQLENDTGYITKDDSVHHADFATADRKGHIIHEYYASKFHPTLFGVTTAPFIVTNSILGGIQEEPKYYRRMDVSTYDHPYWEWYDPAGGYYFYQGAETGLKEDRIQVGAITPQGIYEGGTLLSDKYMPIMDFMTEQDVKDMLSMVLSMETIPDMAEVMTKEDVENLMEHADIIN